MADVIELFDKFKTVIELKDYATTLFKGLKRATELLEQKEQEIKHLQGVLATSIPLIGNSNNSVVRVIKSTEEIILEAEIEKLRGVSNERPLNLNETKQLDIYIKNLRLIRGEADVIDAKPKLVFDDDQLLEAASRVQE